MRLCETLADVLDLVPLKELFGKVFVQVLAYLHDYAVQPAHKNTPPLHRGSKVLLGHSLPRCLPVGVLSRVRAPSKADEEAVRRALDGRSRTLKNCLL